MPSIPTPIRVGVVGLSTSGWASMALIPSMLNLPKAPYKIMGICTLNPKTPQQVEELRQKFGNDLQIYRSPEEMAAARDIDLFVVSVKAPDHEKAVLPALNPGLEHKKDIFIEWPATGFLKASTAIANSAEKLGVRVMVGLQGRQSPTLRKLTQIVKGEGGEHAIGRVLSSCVIGCVPTELKYWGPEVMETHRYVTQIENNASMLSVMVGHLMHPFLRMFGDISTVTASQTISYNESTVVTQDGSRTSEVLRVTTPDTLAFSGVTKANVLFTFHCRAGVALTEGRTNFLWIIDGTEGSIRVEGDGPPGSFLNVKEPSLFINGRKVDVPQNEYGNIGRAWEEFAKGKEGDYPTIHDAIKVHQVAQAVIDSAKDAKQTPVH